MPDITKCDNEECELKNKCYRYTSKPDEYRQAYLTEYPEKDWECELFYPNTD